MKRSIIALLCGFAVTGWASMASGEGAQDAGARAKCQNQLKQLGIVFRMFEGENRGWFPPLSGESGRLNFLLKPVYPEYLTDMSVLICPSASEAEKPVEPVRSVEAAQEVMRNSSYWYLGYALPTEQEAMALVEAVRKAVEDGTTLPQQVPVTLKTASEPVMVHALRGGVEHFYEDKFGGSERARTMIPVMVERSGHHEPGGINVLYMDGHVEFIRMGDKYPATEEFLEALESLDKAIQEASTPLTQEVSAPLTQDAPAQR